MSEASTEWRAIARNGHATLLQRLRDEISQTEAAQAIGVNKSTVCRLVNEHAEHLLSVAALAGLQLVDARAEYLDDEDLQALRRLASRGLQTIGAKGQGD